MKNSLKFFRKEDTGTLAIPKDGSALERRRSLSSIKQMFGAKSGSERSVDVADDKAPLRYVLFLIYYFFLTKTFLYFRQCDSTLMSSTNSYSKFNATGGGPIGSVASLARSATDSNISYIAEYLSEVRLLFNLFNFLQ